MALFLVCSFLIFVVLLRVCIQRLQTGDFGVRMASPKAPLIEILPGSIFVLSFVFALFIVILDRAGGLLSSYILPSALQWGGFTLGIVGLLLTILSQYQMGESWRIGVDSNEKTTLKTEGLYARSRNPIYFGIMLFWIGLCLTLANSFLWLSALVCWFCIELIVRKIEEPYLHKTHGDVFLQYKHQTNRYFPI